LSKEDKVEVVLLKVTLPDGINQASEINPDWKFVRDEIEDIMPYRTYITIEESGLV